MAASQEGDDQIEEYRAARKELSGERCAAVRKAPTGQEGVSLEQEGARCLTARTPEQGKVHQVAKRALNCEGEGEE